jgi:flavin-dependent thymidylate synthase
MFKIDIIGFNNAIDVCSRACASCYKTKLPDTNEGKLDYIKRRIKSGHTSVIEHSNICMTITFVDISKYMKDMLLILSYCRYLNVSVYEEDNATVFIISGSARGFIYLFDKANDEMINSSRYSNYIDDICSAMLSKIINTISWGKAFFEHIEYYNEFRYSLDTEKEDSKEYFLKEEMEIYNIKAKDMSERLFGVDYKYPEIIDIGVGFLKLLELYKDGKLSKNDILKTSTISVRFVNASRTTTHQLVRHRNAITQQSQRYVDYSNSTFTIPNMELYKNALYTAEGFEKNPISFEQICKLEFYRSLKLYKDLVSQGVLKEDARAILPNNTNCYELYMTFTFDNFFKFIELRTDVHAQEEIRKYAICLDKIITPDIREIFYSHL